MKRFHAAGVAFLKERLIFSLAFWAALLLAGPLPLVRGAITATGNIDPDLSSWGTASSNYIGETSDGSLTVDSDSDLQFNYGYLGYNSGVNGAMTVTGSGSTATGHGDLAVGWVGNGTLNITNGGAVNISRTTYVGRYSGSTGTINFGSDGGTLTTGSLAASPSQLTGTGTITTNGLVSDFDLVLDSVAQYYL